MSVGCKSCIAVSDVQNAFSVAEMQNGASGTSTFSTGEWESSNVDIFYGKLCLSSGHIGWSLTYMGNTSNLGTNYYDHNCI